MPPEATDTLNSQGRAARSSIHYQLPPPPPPTPPPANPPPPNPPPEKPLKPAAPGVLGGVEAAADMPAVKPRMLTAIDSGAAPLEVTYQLTAGLRTSSFSNSSAHFFAQWYTIAYGKYSSKMPALSANACRCFSAVTMKYRNPRERRYSSRPKAVRLGMAPAKRYKVRPPMMKGTGKSPPEPSTASATRATQPITQVIRPAFW